VTLTEAGQTLIAEIFPQHEQFLDDLFQGIAAADKQQLIRQLAQVKTVIDRKEGSPDDPQT
jgi:DNA-binding MarR family transcriptional regulator